VAETKIRTILVKAVATGEASIAKLNSTFKKLDKTVSDMGSKMGFLRNMFLGFIAGIGIRQIVLAADSFQLLNDRIKVFAGSAEVANDVMSKLQGIAKYSKTSIESLATSYSRIALATQELGLSQDQILATTLALQQTFRISGATIAEATAATIQLSQGLSSGQLRGQELRSVMEQNTVFAGLLSKELGITRGQLIKFAESGKITSDVVFRALGKNFENLNAQANKMGVTFSQSLTIAIDAIKVKINELNREFGISKGFALFMEYVVNNMGAVTGALSALGIAFVAMAAKATLSIATVKTALITSGWGALIVGIGFVAGAVVENWDLIKAATLSMLKYIELITAKSLNYMKGLWNDFSSFVISSLTSSIEESSPGFSKALDTLGLSVDKMKKKMALSATDIAPIQKELEVLNKEYEKLSNKKSTFDIAQLNTAAQKLTDIKNAVTLGAGAYALLNKELKQGAINLQQYREQLISTEMNKINIEFRDGKINIDEYYSSLLKIPGAMDTITNRSRATMGAAAGVQEEIKRIGDIGTQMSSLVGVATQSLEDQFVKLATTGKFSFQELATAIVEQIARMTTRLLIILPLMKSLEAAMGGGGSGTPLYGSTSTVSPYASMQTNALGNAFHGGKVLPFAKGGIVSSPTIFPFANGTGLMGEAGPEAIMPLQRNSKGQLGVVANSSGVNINIINNTSAEIETQETTNANGERQLDIMIIGRVAKAIGDGRLDKTFNQSYGIRRRGV